MTTTNTEQETETDDLAWQRCSICGGWANVDGQIMRSPNFAHNTCSQRCACTAAIVEAINGWRLANFPQWFVRGPTDSQPDSQPVDDRPITDARSPQHHYPRLATRP